MNLDDYDDDDPSHGNRNLLRTLVASMMMTMIIIIIIKIISISALKRPMTYDDHPIPIPSIQPTYSFEEYLSWTKLN